MPRPDLPPNALPVGPASVIPAPTPPLQGLTILAVEDSRYACEALRLIARRAGARLRRAETLEIARAHLRTYRPDVAIVDLGLPDGRGEALIRELVLARPRARAVIGMSGSISGRDSALAAGADGFLDKPLSSYPAFCSLLAQFLPDRTDLALTGMSPPLPSPDILALHDDLAHAAAALRLDPDRARQRYVSGFLAGLAHVTQDHALAEASDLVAASPAGLAPLRVLLDLRLANGPGQVATRGEGG